jgi:hypothetical protein
MFRSENMTQAGNAGLAYEHIQDFAKMPPHPMKSV